MTTQIMTPQGAARLQQKLETMYARLKEIQQEKAHAYHASGDGWHDNPGWLQLGQQEEQLSYEIQLVQMRLSSAKIVDMQDRGGSDIVQLGSRVHYTLTPVSGGKTSHWEMEIAGSGESNIREKRISYDSPIGKALMGKKAGEKATVELPTGLFNIILQKIE
jgi:transcription elongation factor GreA